MSEWTEIEQILIFAINEEQAAVDFYTTLASQAKAPAMREVFKDFAREEQKHKTKLEAIKAGKTLKRATKEPIDLKIADYLVDVRPTPDMDYRGALVVAMKKEKAAFKLYTDLAKSTPDETLKATFLMLAQEEARHKLGFEIEYDDMMTDN